MKVPVPLASARGVRPVANRRLVGPPGSVKIMLARRLPSVLPPLIFEEALEATKLYSIAGLPPLAGPPLLPPRRRSA
jgi:magnesium chelatase family protein